MNQQMQYTMVCPDCRERTLMVVNVKNGDDIMVDRYAGCVLCGYKIKYD